MDTPASSAYGWAIHEMRFSDFNDERLTQRAVKIAATLLQHPQNSIPAGCGNWSDTKATYRFFANGKVNSSNMFKAHSDETINRCLPFSTILVAQDTTTINLTNKEVTGLGRIGEGTLQGFFTHSALALDTQGIPLGLLYQKTYVRKAITQDEEYKKHFKQLPIEEKETGKWVEVITCIKEKLSSKHVVVIGDRESDIYDVFKKGKESGVDLLIRTSQNRLVSELNGKDFMHLFDKAKQGTVLTKYTASIPTTVNSHKLREAKLTIRVCQFLLHPSKHRRRKDPPLSLFLLDVIEESPPEREEGIHWMLTTTLHVKTPDEAIEKVTWYMYRWRIERFHYILKTGAFNVERLQFETFPRFNKAITMFSIVAYRILFTTYHVRDHPTDNACTIFSTDEVRVLCMINKKQENILTVTEAVVATAKLGGFLARKNDGPPGIKTLWIGFQTLTNIVYGVLMAEQAYSQRK